MRRLRMAFHSLNGFVFAPVIASNRNTGYDILGEAVAAGWDKAKPLIATITVNPSVHVYSDPWARSTGVGLLVSLGSIGLSALPGGSIIHVINHGFILGMGGSGGAGDYRGGGYVGGAGAPGYAGLLEIGRASGRERVL